MVAVKDFTVGEVFRLVNPKGKLTTKELIDGNDIPYVAAKKINNGVAKMCSLENIPDNQVLSGNCIVFIQQGDGSAGYTTYQPDDFYAISCVCCGYIDGVLNERIGMYLMTVLDKNKALYSHSNSWSGEKLIGTKMSLPYKTVVVPDWAMLETLLRVHGCVGINKIDISSWIKFKVSDLFMIEIGDVDLQQKDVNGKGVVLVSACESDMGVIGKTDVPAKVVPENTITVDMLGNVQYRDFPYKMVINGRVFALVPKKPINREVGLYLVSVLQKLMTAFSYNSMCSWNKVKDMELMLPAIEEDVPDWDYMEEYIAGLEQECIAELDRYLVATGLNDYALTDEDLKTLALSGSWRDGAGHPQAVVGICKEMREFRIENVFDVLTSKAKYNANSVVIDESCKIGYPYVVRQADNNGIRGYIEEDIDTLNPARTFSFGQDTATIFWQITPYFTGDKIKVLRPKYDLTDEMAQYMMTGIRRAFSNFSWGQQSFSEEVIKAMGIQLPIQTDVTGQPVINEERKYHPDGYVPDWDYMAAYIRAMEKLVIKSVVDFKDDFIEKAKLAAAG